MPKRRKKIKPELKSALVFEAGNKCANPGCPNWRTHFHHIKHWSVYQTDDEKDMIAVCPSCHDAIHHDRIRISDETLYEWKKSHAPAAPRVAHVFVEPRRAGARLLTGTFAIETHNPGATVFELSNHNMLQFHTSNRDTMLVSSTVIDLTGREVLSVENNYVRSHEDPDVVFDYVAGHVRITAPATGRFIPYPVLAEVRNKEPGYAADGRVVILDLSVVAPGVVRVCGVWAADDGTGVVIMHERMTLAVPGKIIHLVANDFTLIWMGPINKAMFKPLVARLSN